MHTDQKGGGGEATPKGPCSLRLDPLSISPLSWPSTPVRFARLAYRDGQGCPFAVYCCAHGSKPTDDDSHVEARELPNGMGAGSWVKELDVWLPTRGTPKRRSSYRSSVVDRHKPC